MKPVIWIVAAMAAVGLFVAQQRQVAKARAESTAAMARENEARQEAQRATEAAKPNPTEIQRVQEERSELVKLRAEVAALRKEKAAWETKNRAAAESAALAAAENVKKAGEQNAQAMQWVETVLNAPSATKGIESGNLRRKRLNGEPLNEAEQQLLVNLVSRTGGIEKSPEEFAAFQSAFIGSLLGWNSDPRMDQVQKVLTAASNAANNRGYDYHAPGENADKWDDGQKALNSRATGAVQKLLSPEEREAFDKAFLGVLGIDLGIGPRQQ